VLTGDQFRDSVEKQLQRQPELQQRLHFHYIPRDRYRFAERIFPPAYLYSYRYQWQREAYTLGKRLHEQIGFDIVHQLTYVGFRVPGYLWQLDVPFVWGPIGGLEQTTWGLIPSLGFRGGLHFAARNLFNEWDRRFARLPKQAFHAAGGGVIAATSGVQREILRFYGQRSCVISEIGLPPTARVDPRRRLETEPLRLLWCGNFHPGKALPFLLSALKLLPLSLQWNLTIIGDGRCAPKWQRLARKMGLDPRCEWAGRIPRQDVLKQMQRGHALVVTSAHDLTSTVVVEALANGLPVVCPDHCGFKDAVAPECGIRVKATNKREMVEGLRDAIIQMNDEAVRYRLAQGALAQSRKYEWEQKARAVNDIYQTKHRYANAAAETC
jgi:glycosyltransferase involved in cell wall biosynthesis